jgi:hypothetical protein
MSKRSLKSLQIGDAISIRNVDALIKEEVLNMADAGRIEPDYIRAIAALKSDKQYKVVDLCRNCHMLWIKPKSKRVLVRYKYASIP